MIRPVEVLNTVIVMSDPWNNELKPARFARRMRDPIPYACAIERSSREKPLGQVARGLIVAVVVIFAIVGVLASCRG